MKKTFLILFILSAGITISAQQDEKARQILDEVSEKTQACSTISVGFEYYMENQDEGIDEGYSGTIVMKGKKYHIDIGEIGLKMVSDGETVWSYMEDANEVTISSIDEEFTEIIDPTTFFTFYEQGFTTNYSGEKNENGKTLYQIDLIPETDEYDFSKISVAVDKGSMMVYSAVMTDEMGTRYGITTKKLELNIPVDDSIFSFNVSDYDDIEVIDFR